MRDQPTARVLSSHDRSLLAHELRQLRCPEATVAQVLRYWPALAILAESVPRDVIAEVSSIESTRLIGLAHAESGKVLLLCTRGDLADIAGRVRISLAPLISGAQSAVEAYYAPRGITTVGNKTFVWGARTYVMGIINATPDSFSGDGFANEVEAAIAQAERFVVEGADIIDVGGESTRPHSERIGAEEELRRVLPIVQRLARDLPVPVSIDTQKANVAERCLDAGAALVNDIWGLRADPAMASVIARYNVPVVTMHNQQGITYRDLMGDIIAGLRTSLRLAAEAGIPEQQLIVDPGIGFGKSKEQNLEVLHRLDELKVLGRPILLGTSRKSTIGFVLNLPPEDRLEGTAATAALGIALGADMVRVHDVREMARVCKMADAVVRWQPANGEQHWPGQTG